MAHRCRRSYRRCSYYVLWPVSDYFANPVIRSVIMRPSSLGGAAYCVALCLSVCPSVPLSCFTSRHLANYNDTHVLYRTRLGPHIVRPSRPHRFLLTLKRRRECSDKTRRRRPHPDEAAEVLGIWFRHLPLSLFLFLAQCYQLHRFAACDVFICKIITMQLKLSLYKKAFVKTCYAWSRCAECDNQVISYELV